MTAISSGRNYGIRAGIFLAVAGAVSQSLTAGISKYMVQDYHVVQLVWIRNLFLVLVLLMVSRTRLWPTPLRFNRPAFQIGRAFLPLIASALILFSLKRVPLAEATAILFASPLFLTALSVPLLRERVDLGKCGAVVCGFLGVGVILRPGSDFLDWTVLLLLAAAALIAVYQIVTKILSSYADLYSTLFYTGIVGLAATSLPLPFFWRTPDLEGWALTLALGAAYGASQFFWFRALAAAPASTLAPFVYTQIIVATVFGFVVFGEIPDLQGLAGTAIVIGAGIYIFLRSGGSADRQVNHP